VKRDLREAEGKLAERLLYALGRNSDAMPAARLDARAMLESFPPDLEDRLREFGLRGYDLGLLMIQLYYQSSFGRRLVLTRTAAQRLERIERMSDVVSPHAEIEIMAAILGDHEPEHLTMAQNPIAGWQETVGTGKVMLQVDVKLAGATRASLGPLASRITAALEREGVPAGLDLAVGPAKGVEGIFGFKVHVEGRGWLDTTDPAYESLYAIVDKAVKHG